MIVPCTYRHVCTFLPTCKMGLCFPGVVGVQFPMFYNYNSNVNSGEGVQTATPIYLQADRHTDLRMILVFKIKVCDLNTLFKLWVSV